MKSSPRVTAVVLCAGMGSRAGLGYNKVLYPVGNLSVGAFAAKKFDDYSLVVVCSQADEDILRAEIGRDDALFVRGGNTRSDSVRAALNAITDADVVIIHDGARPYIRSEVVKKSVESALVYGSGVVGVRSVNAMRRLNADGSSVAVDRGELFTVQTPQTFRYGEIKRAYKVVQGSFADDAEVYERAGFTVHLVEGDADNVKLTTPADFAGLNGAYRIGYGYDVHKLVENRKLVLCGVTIDYPLGLLGHSDADAPVHALMDALLSAAGLPDIGVLFPDTDERYAGADSVKLLENVCSRLSGFEIVNASICIMAQKPKLASIIPVMRDKLSAVLGIERDRLNVSATTTEGLGVVGEGKGIASAAEVLLKIK